MRESSLGDTATDSSSRLRGFGPIGIFAVTGAVFGVLFAITKSLALPMTIHIAFDLTALVLIYRNWEDSVAHTLFR